MTQAPQASDQRRALYYLGAFVMVVGVVLIVANLFLYGRSIRLPGRVVTEGFTPLGGAVVRSLVGLMLLGIGGLLRRGGRA